MPRNREILDRVQALEDELRIIRQGRVLVIFVATLVMVSCGSDQVCPGHVDPSRGQGLVIRTADGSPTIASVNFRVDPNAIAGASPCSYFTIDRPDASAGSGIPQVTVYMGSSVFVDHDPPWTPEPAPCQMDVASVDGQSVTVTASMISQHQVGQHCVGNYNCCPKSGLEWLGSRGFSPTLVTLPFTQTIDASVDGGTDISPIDLAASTDSGIDASGT
jgi:hypothetical protein